MSASTTLPTLPGFYWWRADKLTLWRMLCVSEVIIPQQSGSVKIHRKADDMNSGAFTGRSLVNWEEHAPVGEWVGPLTPPAN